MGDKVSLTVEERDILGKKVARLRKQGIVPGVVYGHDYDAKPVSAPAPLLEKVYKQAGKHQPVELTIGGTKRLAMIKSADFEPVKRKLRHISFHVVKQNEKVETEVPIEIANEGETAAEKAGLVVLKAVETVEISALPGDLPAHMEVTSDKLVEPGDHVTVADIKPVQGVAIMTDPEIVVASVYEPSALAAQNDALAGEATDESEVQAENGAEAPEEAESTPDQETKK